MQKAVTKRRKFPILYSIRILSILVYSICLIILLPNILETSWKGIVFLIVSTFLLLVTLASFFLSQSEFQKRIGYNLIYIGMVVYFVFIWSRIYFDFRVGLTSLYSLNMEYFANNYLILSFIELGVIINTIFIFLSKED